MVEHGSKIESVSRSAWLRAEALSSQSEGSGPTALHNFASTLGIRQLRFAPILSDAGLGKMKDGYEIVVNIDGSSSRRGPNSRIVMDANEWSQVEPSLRFTIAHEIAHLLFLEAGGGKRDADVFRKHEEAIENGCNILSRMLLLPRKGVLLGSRVVDVAHIVTLLNRYQVSPEVLVRRLHMSDVRGSADDVDGMLALVRGNAGSFTVAACHVVGTLALSRFHHPFKAKKELHKHLSLAKCYSQAKWALEGKPIALISPQLEAILAEGGCEQREVKLSWTEGKVVPCEVTARAVHAGGSSFILGLRVTGHVMTDGETSLL